MKKAALIYEKNRGNRRRILLFKRSGINSSRTGKEDQFTSSKRILLCMCCCGQSKSVAGVIKLNSSANKHQLPEGGLPHPSGPQVGLGAGPPPNLEFVCTVPEPVIPNISRTRETRKNFI